MQNLSNKQIITIYTNVRKKSYNFQMNDEAPESVTKVETAWGQKPYWLVVTVLASSEFPVSAQWMTREIGICVFQNTADGRVNES